MVINEKFKNYMKLFSAGIILLWLFIQSPFNPLYSDYNSGEFNFVILNFFYWMIVAAFMFWLIFFINHSNFEKYSTTIFGLSNFLYLTFYIFYGFDVLDTGFSLSKQWSMYHGLWKENFDAIAGTNLLGGLWLLIPGEPLLIWSRLGFVIVQVSIVYISYKIILLYFKPVQTFVVALPLSLFFATWNLYLTINYDNLPFLFLLLSVYFLLYGLKNEIFKKYFFIFSGVIAILSVFCKTSYIAALFLPVFLIILDNNLLPKTNFKEKMKYFLFGLCIGICVIAGFIYAVGGLESYLFYFGDIINELVSVKDPTKIHPQNHSFIKLFQSYNTDFINVILGLFKNVFIIILIEFFISKTKNLKPIKYLVIIIGAFTLYYFIFDINDYNHYTNNVIMYILSFFISIYVLWTFFTENAIIRKYILLITASIGMFFFSFIGSDLIFRAAFHVNSELILFTLPVILIRESEFKLLNIKVKFTFLFYFILIIFSLQIIYKKDNLYREPNFKFISETFDTPSLAGIKSNPQRVDVIDSLLTYLSTIQDFKEKKVMFTHSNVLMYYLTGANYILSSPWDILNDYYSLKQNLALNKPDYFIVPKESHRIHTWPLKSETDSAESRAKKYYDIYDSFIKGNNYIEIYKNSFYTVYGSNDENKAENK